MARPDCLEALLTEDFEAGMGPEGPSPWLRRRLQMAPQVQRVRAEVERGALSEEEDVGPFIREILDGHLVEGRRFPHSMALAALAVALEGRRTEFAGQFFDILASHEVTEVLTANRVAAECLKRRSA